MDEVTTVSVASAAERFDAATKYLAALAYPESHGQRDRACLAMRALMFRWARKTVRLPSTEATRQALGDTGDRSAGTIRRLEARIDMRLRAADAFARIALRVKPATGALPYSLNQIQRALHVGPRIGRTWHLEVMHLAMALRSVEMHWTDPRGFGIVALLANPDWITTALESAENWAQYRVAGNLPRALANYGAVSAVRLVAATP